MNSIKDLKPTAIWQNFYKLTQVPRPSNHEEQARKFMLEWAKENNIEAEIDEVGNIIMRKPATPGMENRKGVILQGHLDMVPQKNEDTDHDFEKDPIQAYVDGEWVRAKGTTLGADNGMGVAAGMAMLTATDIPHGPLEVLITATEETGMDGANGLKPGVLKGDILLNLDSETEGELYVGCAGGLDSTIEFNYKEEAVPAQVKAFRLGIKGLKGGHSGMDINLGRGNSNKLLFRFLKTYAAELGIRIASVSGGTLRNAIPRESFALVVIPAANETKLQAAIKEAEGIYKAELSAKEPTLQVTKADKIMFDGDYPGWKPNPDSAILKEMQEIYEQLYGKKPAVMAVHAGLECGILGSKYTHWDMISFGPTICSPHSPDERVNIASVGKFWEYLKATLKNIPAK